MSGFDLAGSPSTKTPANAFGGSSALHHPYLSIAKASVRRVSFFARYICALSAAPTRGQSFGLVLGPTIITTTAQDCIVLRFRSQSWNVYQIVSPAVIS
jgi:hypothetical protein